MGTPEKCLSKVSRSGINCCGRYLRKVNQQTRHPIDRDVLAPSYCQDTNGGAQMSEINYDHLQLKPK
jgi:hypothetical protein